VNSQGDTKLCENIQLHTQLHTQLLDWLLCGHVAKLQVQLLQGLRTLSLCVFLLRAS
jgi:hypothetical protein